MLVTLEMSFSVWKLAHCSNSLLQIFFYKEYGWICSQSSQTVFSINMKLSSFFMNKKYVFAISLDQNNSLDISSFDIFNFFLDFEEPPLSPVPVTRKSVTKALLMTSRKPVTVFTHNGKLPGISSSFIYGWLMVPISQTVRQQHLNVPSLVATFDLLI